jgi:hypothetical protein
MSPSVTDFGDPSTIEGAVVTNFARLDISTDFERLDVSTDLQGVTLDDIIEAANNGDFVKNGI